MTLLITYLVVAIGISFLCSILEAVLLSVTPAFVESQQEQHPRQSGVLLSVKENLDQSLSAILILNTFAHTMGAAGVGAQAVRVFGAQWESLVAFLLTLVILYFSEIIPKTLGATYWKKLAIPAAYTIAALVKLLLPFVWLASRMTRLFGGDKEGVVSRDELAALAKLGERHGTLGSQESQLMENILQLRATRTREILTPRTVVAALDASDTVSEGIAELGDSPFTRIPLYDGDLDTVEGLVFKSRILQAEREGSGDVRLSELAVPVFRVAEELPVLQLLDQFIKRREHMFVVEDSYGQTSGIVTLEDAVETLLGREIMDESDTVEDMQALAKSKYRSRLSNKQRSDSAS